MSTKKEFLFIIGMHRSGTSAVAGCFSHLGGYDLGKQLIPPSFDNKKGFFENRLITNLNEALLKAIGRSWDSLMPMPDDWIEYDLIDSFFQKAISIVNNEFTEDLPILIKDPRICLLLPFWLKVVYHFEASAKAIIVIREPISVAKSLNKRNNIPLNIGQLLWAKYMLNIQKHIKDVQHAFISFNSLINAPSVTIDKQIRTLKLGKPSSKKKLKTLRDFISASLNHNATSEDVEEIVRNKKIDRYYEVLHLISNTTKANRLDSKFKKTFNSLLESLDFYYQGLIEPKIFFAQLSFIESESVKSTKKIELSTGNQQLNFEFIKNKNIDTIILHPCNSSSYLQLNRVIINYNQTFDILNATQTESIMEHGIEYIFDQNGFIKFDVGEYDHIESVSFDIQYRALGQAAVNSIKHLVQSSNEWFYKRMEIIEEDKNRLEQEFQEQQQKIEQQSLEKYQEVEGKLSLSETNLEQSNQQINQFEKIVKEKEAMLEKEKQQSKKLFKDLNDLTNDNIEQQKLLEEAIASIEKHKADNNAFIQSVKQQHQKTIDKTNTEIEKIKAENLAHKDSIVQKQNEILEKERLLLKSEFQLEQKDFFLDQLQTKLDDKEKDIQHIESKVQNQQEKISQLNEQISVKEATIKNLNQKVEELQSELKETKKQTKNNIDHNSIEKIEHVKQQLADKNIEVTNLLANLKFEEEKNKSVNELIQMIFNELEEKDSSIKIKAEALQSAQQNIATLSSQVEEKKKVLQEKIDELNHFKTQVQHFSSEKQEQSNQIVLQDAQINTIKNLLQSSEELIRNQHAEINELQQIILNLDRNYADLKSSVSFKTGWAVTSPFRWVYDKIYKNKPFNQSQMWLWMQFFNNGISKPGAFLKNVNAKNISTLRKALTNESPEQIAANLKKLIAGSNNGSAVISSENATVTAAIQQPETIESIASSPIEPVQKDVIQTHGAGTINGLFPRPKVLYISPNLPDYDTSSGGKRATRMLELLAQDCDVYAFTRGSMPEKYIQKLSEVGVIVLRTTDYNQIRRRVHHIDTIIYAWYYTYFDANRFTQLYPDAKIVVDSVDVHWVRETRSLGIWEGLTQETVDANKKRELESYRNADIVWAVTENDKKAIIAELPDADVRVVSNIHEHVKDNFEDTNNNNLLFIGGFNHYPNISAVKLLVNDILPKIRQQVPDATLTIAGANAPEEIQDLGKLPGVIYKGFIEEEDMDALYDNSFATISPLLAGAGIKGKICESISYMTPVITNAIGNEGIELENINDGLITDDFDEMANLAARALKREFDFDTMTKNAQHKLHGLVGSETVKQRMMSSILPEISICIVTWNRLELLKRCIESVEGNTNYPYYKIIVHSNGCEDGTQAYLEAAAKINPKIIPVLSKDNDVFVIPNNQMMMQYPDNDVVLLNNDTYVTPNWLIGLYKAAYSSSEIGISGSKIMYPDGRLQEFGSELYENGSGRNIGKWDENPNKPEYSQQTAVGYVSGCSMYIKRSTINKIGVFDLQFHPCYCEDSDYCYTAWEHNIQTVVTPLSVIYHDEGGTSGTDTSSGFKRYQEVNFKKFLDKHKSNLSQIAEQIKELN